MSISTTYQPNAPQATTGQGSAVGNREDLSDVLTLLAPEQTPFLSICKKEKAESTFVEWTTDTLAAPNADGILEKEDESTYADKFANRARLGNYVQIFRKPWQVSTLQNAVKSVGPANAAQAEIKCMREIKRDMEFAFLSDSDRQADNGTLPYKLRGLGDWLDSAGPADVAAPFRTPAASIVASDAPTETDVNAIIGSIFSVNGEMNSLTLIAGTTIKRIISEFTRADSETGKLTYQVTQPAESKKITLSVNLYDSDFGIVKIVNGNPACLAADKAYFVNPDYVACSTLVPLTSERNENRGGGDRGFVECAATLVVRHPGAHGKIIPGA